MKSGEKLSKIWFKKFVYKINLRQVPLKENVKGTYCTKNYCKSLLLNNVSKQ